MIIAIAGGSGFIGKALADYLISKHHTVFILSRNPNKQHMKQNGKVVKWLTETSNPAQELEGVDAIINLAGQSINARWTEQKKREILESRINATTMIEKIISTLSKKPKVVINASAVGIYGTSLKATFTEMTKTFGNDFLAQTVLKWEEAAKKIEKHGIRTVMARFGVVLGRNGGAFPKMVLPYKLFIGGTMGSGLQWVPWIHIQDVVQILEYILINSSISGPVNVTAPHPVTMEEFGRKISKNLRRPHWLPVPRFALKCLLGEMSLLVLEGQKVIPEKLQQAGYTFSFSTLDVALQDLL